MWVAVLQKIPEISGCLVAGIISPYSVSIGSCLWEEYMYPLWTSLCLPLEHWMNWIKGLSVVVKIRLECGKGGKVAAE